MTKIISFINNKGGVGKTTVCGHVGYALSQFHEKRILLVDFDPQANLSIGFAAHGENNIGAMLTGAIVKPKRLHERLDIISTTIALEDTEELLVVNKDVYALQTALNPLQTQYDYILIDCPPRLSMITRNALYASTDVCMVTDAGFYTQVGLGNIIKFVEKVQEKRRSLNLSSVVLSRYDGRRAASKESHQIYKTEFGSRYLDTPIRENAAMVDASAQQRTIFEYRKNSLVAKDLKELTIKFIHHYEDNNHERN